MDAIVLPKPRASTIIKWITGDIPVKTVLLVEDDKETTFALCIRLKSMGYEIVTAPDAVGAISQARRAQADVAVIDISLPGGDGFLVAERLNALVGSPAIPLIFMTASKKPGLRERAEELGAIAFLEKPFDAKQLVSAIDTAIHMEAHFEHNPIEMVG